MCGTHSSKSQAPEILQESTQNERKWHRHQAPPARQALRPLLLKALHSLVKLPAGNISFIQSRTLVSTNFTHSDSVDFADWRYPASRRPLQEQECINLPICGCSNRQAISLGGRLQNCNDRLDPMINRPTVVIKSLMLTDQSRSSTQQRA